jgi:hypothetical protein
MRVIFLDFDGVLNSAASFVMENRRHGKDKRLKRPLNEHLDRVCTSNFQYILDKCPDVKIVISSTWRIQHSLPWLKKKLKSYGIDASRVIGKTPESFGGFRGHEISLWLDKHDDVTDYIVIDDNSLLDNTHDNVFIKTSWDTGLTLKHVYEALKKFGVELKSEE